MSKRIIFEEVKQRLIDKIPEVKTIRLWNNQVTNENVENAFNYPAVFIEFSEILFVKENAGLQSFSGILRLYVVQEEYRTENLDNLDFVDQVAAAINGFQTDTIIKPLWRDREFQDVNHNNLIVWEQDYPLMANDCTSSKYNDAVEIPGGSVEVIAERDTEVTLDIDNDVIRTGDGQ